MHYLPFSIRFHTISRLFSIFALLAAGISLSGCVAAVVAGATATGVMIAQERTFGTALDDSTTDIAIQSRLSHAGGKAMRNVNVDVHDGIVLLTGTVPRPEDRVTAARVAWDTASIREVINELEVRDGSRFLRLPKDHWISTRVRSSLMVASKVKNINYGVETVDGTVYLFGIARSQSELDVATARVRRIGGVKQVISHVRVKQGPLRQSLPQPVTVGQL